ncbi:MAG: hypothetical protein KC589_04225, partial [Nanoarchaeota archaeon]|nr:hypothetical protein [Nanoarchaeota archaeon]
MTANYKKIIYLLSPLERKVLPQILDICDIKLISEKLNLKEAEVTTAVHLLEQRGFTIFEKTQEKIIELDKFGKIYLEKDLPEIKLLKEIIISPRKQSETSLTQEEIAAALGILKRHNLLDIKKEGKDMIFTALEGAKDYLAKNLDNPLKEFKSKILVSNLTQKQKDILESFKMRKGFLKENIEKKFILSLSNEGKNIAKELKKNYSNLELLELLDMDILKTSSWKGKEFRHYDVKVETSILDIGRRHPMLEANNILRDIFVEMGFKEMEGPMVESAFWNMDIMWIPQDHPA